MKRSVTFFTTAIIAIALSLPSHFLNALCTYENVDSESFESEFRNRNSGSTEGLDRERNHFADQSLNSRQSLQTAAQQHIEQNAYSMRIRSNQRAFGYSVLTLMIRHSDLSS